MRFLHAADIHLDSPLQGIERYEDAPLDMIRGASRKALQNLVGLAVDEEVDFVLIAGDLYDGTWKDYRTGLFFVRQMARLKEEGIRVFLVTGNHDAQSRITKALSLPDNVTKFPEKHPKTEILEDLGVAIHGQGYADREVTENLASTFPPAEAGLFNIGLLHTSLDGRERHAPYAPCTLDDLSSKGYSYWALGHVHKRETVSESPFIVFPGCLQGRHIRENGPKGCTLVTVDEGEVTEATHQCLDVVRWSLCEVDVTNADKPESALGLVRDAMEGEVERADGRPLALRLRLLGDCGADQAFRARPEHWTQEFRSLGVSMGDGELWMEKVEFRTGRKRELEEALARDDALGGLLRVVQDDAEDEEIIRAMRDEFMVLDTKLPREAKAPPHGWSPADDDIIARCLGEARSLLLGRLLSSENES